MTMKHVVDGLMQVTRCRSHSQLARLCDIEQATVSGIWCGKIHGISLRTFEKLQVGTGVSADCMLGWYRMPDEAELGRVKLDGDKP
jgi:transcriptional regulator with XRE-family HTH domain